MRAGLSPKPTGSGSERFHRVPARNVPEEDEDGFLIGDPIHVVIIVQERLDGIYEASVHLIHFIEYEDGPRAGTHVAADPQL